MGEGCAVAQETWAIERLANRFKLLMVSGNCRSTLALFAVNFMTVKGCTEAFPVGIGGIEMPTLICEAEAYNNWAGRPSKVIATPPSVADPFGALTAFVGPRLEPKIEINWSAPSAPTWVRLPPSNTHAITGTLARLVAKSTADK